MNLEKARFNMIEQQIRPWDVLDQRVLDRIAVLPRDEFVPPEFQRLAYADIHVPIGGGQVMMTPKVEARMAQELRLAAEDTVLEIGTGSGFVTALLAGLAHQVYSVEVHASLSQAAAARLSAHGVDNVSLEVGDAARGWEAHGPYDAIAVTGSVPMLEDHFQSQLKVGGRLFVIVGESPVMEALLIERLSKRDFARHSLFETDLPPLAGIERPQEFVL